MAIRPLSRSPHDCGDPTSRANEKLVSLFEPHADIIVKGGRAVQYQAGASMYIHRLRNAVMTVVPRLRRSQERTARAYPDIAKVKESGSL
jgi:hypothetical protein